MEIGSLAEWVEGLGELLAVSVALFLPYYQQHKNNKERNQRAKQVIIGTSGTLMNQTHIQTSTNLEELQKFVEIYSVLSTNNKTMEIIQSGDEILEVIGKKDELTDSQKSQIKQIIIKLKDVKS